MVPTVSSVPYRSKRTQSTGCAATLALTVRQTRRVLRRIDGSRLPGGSPKGIKDRDVEATIGSDQAFIAAEYAPCPEVEIGAPHICDPSTRLPDDDGAGPPTLARRRRCPPAHTLSRGKVAGSPTASQIRNCGANKWRSSYPDVVVAHPGVPKIRCRSLGIGNHRSFSGGEVVHRLLHPRRARQFSSGASVEPAGR